MDTETISDYFDKHQEQAFIAKTLAMVLVIIVARDFLAGMLSFLILLFPLLFAIYIRFQMATTHNSFFTVLKEHITFIPVMRTAEERKTEKTPWVTYSLIACNFVIFYCIQTTVDPQVIADNFILLPEQPTFWNVPFSALTSMFLHAGNGHLWGNMAFLWVVGSAVERRIDSGSFLFLYLFTGLMGGILYILVEYAALDSVGHMLGASGAIAGIMGIFAVRCYFKSMIFPLPILGVFSLLLPVSLKIRLNSLLIIGIFFFSDLSGGLAQLAGSDSRIGHWVHLGGMITGMLVAGLFLRLGEDAIEERHLEIGIKASETAMDMGEGEKSLSIALERNPENGEALLALAQLKTKFNATEEGAELYRRAMPLLLKSNPAKAIEAFRDYSRKYAPVLEPKLLDSLGYSALRLNDREMAVRCFSLLADLPDTPSRDRERALFQCGKSLEELGEFEKANQRFVQLLQEFPDAAVAPKLRLKLEAAETVNPPPPVPAPGKDPVNSSAPPAEPASAVAAETRSCPACAAAMRRRRASSGAHAGKLFWVCAAFPECRQVLPVQEGNTA